MNNKKQEVLRILREKQGEFVSGQFLCEKLQVSRTTIWKYLFPTKVMLLGKVRMFYQRRRFLAACRRSV